MLIGWLVLLCARKWCFVVEIHTCCCLFIHATSTSSFCNLCLVKCSCGAVYIYLCEMRTQLNWRLISYMFANTRSLNVFLNSIQNYTAWFWCANISHFAKNSNPTISSREFVQLKKPEPVSPLSGRYWWTVAHIHFDQDCSNDLTQCLPKQKSQVYEEIISRCALPGAVFLKI